MPILETRDLTFVYGPKTPYEMTAIKQVNLTVEQGEFIGVIGHTGSGKSTLMQQLNGLLKPTSGQVLVNGKDIWEKPDEIRKVRFEVGLVFQYPEHQLFEDTCYKDIAFGPKNMGLSQVEIEERVYQAAQFTGLSEHLLQKSPFELSGGEKRRVAIAGVLALQPKILILDEPTAGLDPSGRDQLLEQIEAYRRKTGSTVLLVSHNMDDIARSADRILVMNKAEVAMFDTVEAVFQRAEELRQMGLEIPEITKIFVKLREMGHSIRTDVYTVPYAKRVLLDMLLK